MPHPFLFPVRKWTCGAEQGPKERGQSSILTLRGTIIKRLVLELVGTRPNTRIIFYPNRTRDMISPDQSHPGADNHIKMQI